MAEPTQYVFELVEATEALIKKQGLHKGRWMLGFEFGFNAALAGQNPDELKPSAIIAINRIMLAMAPQDAPDTPLIVDAAKINPAQTAAKKVKKAE